MSVRRFAVLASGSGSNFEALVLAARAATPESGCRFEVCTLVVDRADAVAIQRAERLGVPWKYVSYADRPRAQAEAEIGNILRDSRADLVALAGFMRLLSPNFVSAWRGRIVNIHPSLLPAYPGAHALERQHRDRIATYGVTIHYVDEGMDTGPVLERRPVTMPANASLDEVERIIHEVEHMLYPAVVLRLLASMEDGKRLAP